VKGLIINTRYNYKINSGKEKLMCMPRKLFTSTLYQNGVDFAHIVVICKQYTLLWRLPLLLPGQDEDEKFKTSTLHSQEAKQNAAPKNRRNPRRSDSIESSLVREKWLTDVPWKLPCSHISSLYMPNHIAPVLPAARYL
jgi:hypothetical protein